MAEISVTIRELYERVWAQPTSTVAKEFGISDRGLGKICEAREIPVPGRGYWRRVETGQTPPCPPLPAHVDPEQKLWFNPQPPRPPAPFKATIAIAIATTPAARIPPRTIFLSKVMCFLGGRCSKGSYRRHVRPIQRRTVPNPHGPHSASGGDGVGRVEVDGRAASAARRHAGVVGGSRWCRSLRVTSVDSRMLGH